MPKRDDPRIDVVDLLPFLLIGALLLWLVLSGGWDASPDVPFPETTRPLFPDDG